MKASITILALTTATACLLARDHHPVVTPIGKDDVAASPDRKAQCFVDYSASDGWNDVQIKFADGKQQSIWKATRSVGASWSPSGRYLALEDYLDRLATAVLVFRLDYTEQKAELIYQSPYSHSVFDRFQIEGWSDDGSVISIKRTSASATAQKAKEKVPLNDKRAISETIYCHSQ
jgi:hypothetical protein